MNILIADDHPLYIEGLSVALRGFFTDEVHIIEAHNYDEVISRIDDATLHLDLVLLDLFMTGDNWDTAISIHCRTRPDTPLIVISSSESLDDADKVIEAGSYGYIPKSLAKEEILSAIQLIITQDICVRPRIDEYEKVDKTVEKKINDLTPRQKDVLFHIKEGKSNKLIARELSMTEGTVKLHVAAILKRLSVNNRTQAALMAKQVKFRANDNE